MTPHKKIKCFLIDFFSKSVFFLITQYVNSIKNMDTVTTIFSVRHCSKCQRDTEYFCESCSCDLCPLCKDSHVQNLKTIDHSVILYRGKLKFIRNQTKIQRRQDSLYGKYVTISRFSEFADSIEHRKISIFDTKPLKQAKLYRTIRNEALFYRDVLLSRVKADINNCQKEFSVYQLGVLTKTQKLKDHIDNALRYVDFKHRCLKQIKKNEQTYYHYPKFWA